MTLPKNQFPFFKILVFEILVFLYAKREISKKNSWKQHANKAAMWKWRHHHFWRQTSRISTVTSTPREFVFVFFAKPCLWYAAPPPKKKTPIITRAIFSERHSEYMLVPSYSWHQVFLQFFFIHRTTFIFCCKISHLNFYNNFNNIPKLQ